MVFSGIVSSKILMRIRLKADTFSLTTDVFLGIYCNSYNSSRVKLSAKGVDIFLKSPIGEVTIKYVSMYVCIFLFHHSGFPG